MRALPSMLKKLKPLGLYRFTGSSLIEAELNAAAKGLDMIYEALEGLTREAFLPTAEGMGLAMREKAFGSERPELSQQLRQEMLLYRGAVTVNDNNKDSMQKALLAIGLNAQIFENAKQQRLTVICHQIMDNHMQRQQLISAASQFLPAHLETEFDFGKVSWAYLREQNQSFFQLHQLGYSWRQIKELEE